MDGNRYQNEDRYRDKMEHHMMGRPDKHDKRKEKNKDDESDQGKGNKGKH